MTAEEVEQYGFDKYLKFFNEFPVESVSSWVESKTFIEHLKQNFKAVIDYSNSFIFQNKHTNLNLEEHYTSILNVVELAANGLHSKAFYKLTDLLEKTKSFLKNILSSEQAFTFPSGNFLRAYKMRVNCPEAKHIDFFHIPFDKLYLSQNNRFSLQGIPCIYYGSTVYVCWEELDRPQIENTYIVRAQLNLKFMDLSITPSYLALGYHPEILSQVSKDKISQYEIRTLYNFSQYLLIWPLIFASSVKVKYKESIFRPEYLLSHLLLEWVKQNSEYDGIKYLSTRSSLLTPESIRQITNFYNCVVPVKNVKDDGYCEILSQKISWSDPISYNIIKLLNALPSLEYKKFEVPNEVGYYSNNYKYEFTIFGQIENILLKKKDYKLSEKI